MAEQPIVIVGGGIGGLTAALALGRAGIPCLVIEQRTQIEEVGAGLQLSPNASRILIELGLGPAVLRYASTPERLRIKSGSNGKELAQMPLGNAMAARFGAPYWSIHRADLHTLLLDAVRRINHVRLIFGRKITKIIDNSNSELVLRCQSTTTQEDVVCSALIGADGLWSDTARLVGDDSSPTFLGYQAWRGLIPIQNWPEHLTSTESCLWLGHKAHLVHYPVRNGEAINIVAVTSDGENRPGWSHPGNPDKISARFKKWTPEAYDAIKSVKEWTIWSLYDRPERSIWGKNQITLLGDAAHPVLPFLAQGAALAIEDSATLAKQIIQSPSDLNKALRTYESIRKIRATRIQKTARSNGQVYHLGWPFDQIRNRIIRATNFETRYDWIYNHKVD